MGGSYWQQLIEKHGLEGARAVMRSHTAKRKTSGFAAMTAKQRKLFSARGVAARKAKSKGRTSETGRSRHKIQPLDKN